MKNFIYLLSAKGRAKKIRWAVWPKLELGETHENVILMSTGPEAIEATLWGGEGTLNYALLLQDWREEYCMWVIDIRHWLNEDKTGPAVLQLKAKVKKMAEIITYATSVENDLLADDPPKCWCRPKRRPCRGLLEILFTDDERIYWKCPNCDNEGVISGWQGLIWDMSDYSEGNVH